VSAAVLTLLGADQDRAARDRLEVLTALIMAPGFDPVLRGDISRIPRDHPVYSWACAVAGCERPRVPQWHLCPSHDDQWRASGLARDAFVRAAEPLPRVVRAAPPCRICPDRSAFNLQTLLCRRHDARWRNHNGRAARRPGPGFEEWLAAQHPFPGYGPCAVVACDDRALSPLGLCGTHQRRYQQAGRPGGAVLPDAWFNRYDRHGEPVPVHCADRDAFARWSSAEPPVMRAGQVSLRGLRPLARAEIQWGLHAHGQAEAHRVWGLPWIQALADQCRRRHLNSLLDADPAEFTGRWPPVIAQEMIAELRLIYLSPQDTRDAGFIAPRQFGAVFAYRPGCVDLTGILQRWLRDLAWDHLAGVLRSPRCPRSPGFIDRTRRCCIELCAYLQHSAPGGGHDPRVLRGEHMDRFVAEVRRQERLRLPSLTLRSRIQGENAVITAQQRAQLFTYWRQVLRGALESGMAERLGLDREFITAVPTGGWVKAGKRKPFPDHVARALADETNLQLLARYDHADRGLRDVWEAIVCTGRRAGEVIGLRLDCLGRYQGLAMLWHDQPKVDNYDQAIRIPEPLYQRLAERQRKTLAWFAARHGGRPASAKEQAAMALFPSEHRNPEGRRSLSYQWFRQGFHQWLAELDLGGYVAHQARHTLATRLLRHGATLAHIRKYLGHVSDQMVEHYAQVAVSEIEDVLQHVWVAGPGAPNPGEVLSSHLTPMNRLQAEALALDLSRRSTPTEGGFCTFQPVVDGGACPWKLNCEGCDKFVLSGADLLYWRRKREQWHSIAERAPDDTTAGYLHKVFEPTAQAIDGLEKALAGLGLLDDALALDLRRPQDHFQRLWNTGFRATDLAQAAAGEQTELGDRPDGADNREAATA